MKTTDDLVGRVVTVDGVRAHRGDLWCIAVDRERQTAHVSPVNPCDDLDFARESAFVVNLNKVK